MYDFCTADLQKQLTPARTALRDYQDKLALVSALRSSADNVVHKVAATCVAALVGSAVDMQGCGGCVEVWIVASDW